MLPNKKSLKQWQIKNHGFYERKKYQKYFIICAKPVDIFPQEGRGRLIWAANLANAAANLGYRTVLVGRDRPHSNPFKWFNFFHPKAPGKYLQEFYSLQNKFAILSLRTSPFDKILHEERLNKLMIKYYFPLYVFPHAKLIYTRDWRLVEKSVSSNIPTIYEEHTVDGRLPVEKFNTAIVRNPLLRLSIAITDDVREEMVRRGMPLRKTITIPSGLNKSLFLRHEREAAAFRRNILQNRERKKLAVYAGGLYEWRGIDFLIDVARKLTKVQFVIAGGTTKHIKYYKNLLFKCNIKNIDFLGYLPHKHIPQLFQAADILLFPYRSEKIGRITFPLKFFEYMASGTPIIATEIPPLVKFRSLLEATLWCKLNHNATEFAVCCEKALRCYPRKEQGYKKNIVLARQFTWENRIKKIYKWLE